MQISPLLFPIGHISFSNPSPLYKGTPREECYTQFHHEFHVPWAPPPPWCASLLWPLSSTSISPTWPPEGLCEIEITPPLHVVVLRSFRIRSRGHRDHRIYASTWRWCLCGTGVVAPRSSRPWGRQCHLHRQRLCGSVIPTFGLRGYVSDSLLIVTTLLDK
jgi:hypothetical protein